MSLNEHDNEKPHRLEDITKRLYSNNPNALPRHKQGILHQVNHAAQTVWQDDTTQKVVTKVTDASLNTSLFKKFFYGSIGFFIVALGIGLFMFFSGSNNVSSDNVDINVLGNTYTPGGEDLPLAVEIVNRNAVVLENSDLIIEYGKNKADVSDPSDIARTRISLGTIDVGKIKNQKVNLTLYGSEGTLKDVKFTLQYRLGGSNAVFQKEKLYQVNINSAPVTILVEGATSVSADQPYTLTISVTPNVKRIIPNTMVRIEYPTGFKFQNAEPAPSYLDNIWSVGDLNPGETKQIKIVGTLTAQDGEERSFHAYVGTQDTQNKNVIGTTFASILQTVDIVRPFLEAHLTLNGKPDQEVVVQSGSTVNAQIAWGNNLPIKILDAHITAKLIGDLVDKSSVQVQNGFYNSSDNSITWGRDTFDALGVVDPGETGTIGFTFNTLSLYQQNQLVQNPQIAIEISISGKQPQEGTYSKSVDGFERKLIKFGTNFQITNQSFYVTGPFTNTGPIPPQADKKTTYTIKWTLTNSANEVGGVVVRGSLPPYVHFLNVVSPTNADIKIDPVSGDIVWRAGSIPKGAGFGGNPVTAYFQVELTPSVSQIGQIPILVNSVQATGTDMYTTMPVSANYREVTTRLLNDGTYHLGDEKVVPASQ